MLNQSLKSGGSHALYAVVHIHLLHCNTAINQLPPIIINVCILCLREDEMCSVRFTDKQVFVVMVTGFYFCRLC